MASQVDALAAAVFPHKDSMDLTSADYSKTKTTGLALDVAGEWELKSMAAGSIPEQQYRLTLQHDLTNGNIIGTSTKGSFSAVSMPGSLFGTKINFTETWTQGGTCLVNGRTSSSGRYILLGHV